MPLPANIVDEKGHPLVQFKDIYRSDFLDFPLGWHLSLTFLNQNRVADDSLHLIMRGGKASLDYRLRQVRSRSFRNKTILTSCN